MYDPHGIVALSSSQMTVTTGTFHVRARAPFFRTGDHRLRVQDVTNAVTLALGGNSYSNNAANDGASAEVVGRFTVGAPIVVELQYRVEATKATDGLGTLTNWAVVEVYGEIEFWREA